MEPAPVAGAVVRAEGDQQKQQKNVEQYQRHPMLGHGVHIDGGDHCVHEDAQHDGNDLDNNVPGAGAFKFRRPGGTGNDDQAEARSDQTQNQKHPVGFFGKVLQFF